MEAALPAVKLEVPLSWRSELDRVVGRRIKGDLP